jgi:hypothetical protein
MSKLLDIINSEAALTKQLSLKVNSETNTLLLKVFAYRHSRGLSRDFSEFHRQMLTVSLLMDDPENYLPKFDIPNIDMIIEGYDIAVIEDTENPIDLETENINHEY